MTKPRVGDVYVSAQQGTSFIIVEIMDQAREVIMVRRPDEEDVWRLNIAAIDPEIGWYRKQTKLDKALK